MIIPADKTLLQQEKQFKGLIELRTYLQSLQLLLPINMNPWTKNFTVFCRVFIIDVYKAARFS